MTLSHFFNSKTNQPFLKGIVCHSKKAKTQPTSKHGGCKGACADTCSCAWSLRCFSLLWSQKAVIGSGPLLNPGWLRVYVWHTGLEINPSAACRKTRQMCIVTVQFPPKPQDAATPRLALRWASSDLTKHIGSALCLAQEAVLESRWHWKQRVSTTVSVTGFWHSE